MASVVPILHNLLNHPSASYLSQSLFSKSTYHNSKILFLPNKPNSPIIKCFSSSISSLTPELINEFEDESLILEENSSSESEPPLSEVWKEIQGINNWEGLLDPMNPHLRDGELAQACYDSFDFDPHSKYCGTCKYHPSHFFEKLNMGYTGYTITRYLYATSNINLVVSFVGMKGEKDEIEEVKIKQIY